ncbi:hypothetical protein PVAG01_06801 [Phlyctema vagabunda]|uniref:Uncharacterized protein n=1 Tax=Phlyctema vagabunda TaxID=108571 RepID=A0ABR4PH88_9HELO
MISPEAPITDSTSNSPCHSPRIPERQTWGVASVGFTEQLFSNRKPRHATQRIPSPTFCYFTEYAQSTAGIAFSVSSARGIMMVVR